MELIGIYILFYQDALKSVKICERDQMHAFELIAAVLWLGNISFEVIDSENHVEPVANEGKLLC